MASEHEREMTLSDGRLVDVFYTVESYGSDPSFGSLPENYDPGEGPELYVTKVTLSVPRPDDPDLVAAWSKGEAPFDDAALKIEIADQERNRLETIIAENSDWWMPSDDYDWEF